MEKFTIEEIKNYLLQKDSIRDIIHNLSEQNIKKANKTISFTLLLTCFFRKKSNSCCLFYP